MLSGNSNVVTGPISRISIYDAVVGIKEYKGTQPNLPEVNAVPDSVEAFVDWEMSHRSHKLLFDTPGFHIGIRGTWGAGFPLLSEAEVRGVTAPTLLVTGERSPALFRRDLVSSSK